MHRSPSPPSLNIVLVELLVRHRLVLDEGDHSGERILHVEHPLLESIQIFRHGHWWDVHNPRVVHLGPDVPVVLSILQRGARRGCQAFGHWLCLGFGRLVTTIGHDWQALVRDLLVPFHGFDLQLGESDEPSVTLLGARLVSAQHEHHPLGVPPCLLEGSPLVLGPE